MGYQSHGLYGTSVYFIWSGIKGRCYNPNNSSYSRYGGRGILMCYRLRTSVRAFSRILGPRPSVRHSVDRRDNSLGYNCGQCGECRENGWEANIAWADPIQQGNNKRNNRLIEYQGEVRSIGAWERELGLRKNFLYERLVVSGWTVEQAFTFEKGTFAKPNPPRGSRQGGARFTESDIPVIRQLLRDGAKEKAVADKYGVARTTIADINNGRTWGHVAG